MSTEYQPQLFTDEELTPPTEAGVHVDDIENLYFQPPKADDPTPPLSITQQAEPKPYVTAHGGPNSFVFLKDRAELLDNALKAFSSMNQRYGFNVVSRSPHQNGPVWGRYRSNTPAVQRGANRKIDELGDEAKRSFWMATGYSAVRASGLMEPDDINARAENDWLHFSQQYSRIGASAIRHKYSRKLARTVKRIEKVEAGEQSRAA